MRSRDLCVCGCFTLVMVVNVGAGGRKSGTVRRRHGQQAQDAGARSKLAAQVDQHSGLSSFLLLFEIL